MIIIIIIIIIQIIIIIIVIMWRDNFFAIFNTVGLKPWLSAINHIRNAPRTSRESYQVKESRKEELSFVFSLPVFQSKWQELKKFAWQDETSSY